MKVKPTQEPTEIDLVKAAVIIDCEGNIEINGKPGMRYQLQVGFASTNPVMTRWCAARFGGYLFDQWYEKRPPNRADADRWRIQSYPAAELLKKCLDHFIIKRDQAEIAIRFQATYKVPGQRASHSTKLLREELRQQLLALTATGPKRPPREVAKIEPIPSTQGNLFAN
jgi:hypothetical protein